MGLPTPAGPPGAGDAGRRARPEPPPSGCVVGRRVGRPRGPVGPHAAGGRARTTSSGRAESQRRRVAPSPRRRTSSTRSSTILAAQPASPAAMACRTASSTSPRPGDQAVVAVPAALPVQGNQEQVGPLEVLEQLLAVRAASDPSLRPLLQQRNALLRQVEAPYLPQEGNGLFVGDSRPGRQ